MTFNAELAERVRSHITVRDGVTERRMFGGMAWMVTGNMACGVLSDGRLIVRLDPDEVDAALAEVFISRWQPQGRPMGNFVVIDADDDAVIAEWIDAGADYAATLPPK